MPGPAEGPGKILKYRSNLRLYPADFGNKLCILIFIILSIWPNFLTPPPFTAENFLVPPFGNSKLFLPPPPPFCPAPPPPRYLWTLPYHTKNVQGCVTIVPYLFVYTFLLTGIFWNETYFAIPIPKILMKLKKILTFFIHVRRRSSLLLASCGIANLKVALGFSFLYGSHPCI